MSTYLVSVDVGVGLAGIIRGVLIDTLGFGTVYYIVAVLLVASLVMSILFFGKKYSPSKVRSNTI
jgi:predicted MFS family arabinose efflux permease